MSREANRAATLRRHDFTEANDFFAMLGESFDSGIRLPPIEYGHHADPAIEGAQHFMLGDLSGGGQPFEYRQNRHALERYANPEPGRQHTRDIFGKAAAGNMRERLHRFSVADCSETGAHIKPRWRQKRVAEILPRRERSGAIPTQSNVAHDLSNQ